MAGILGGFGVPHNPHFPRWVAERRPPAAEIERLYGAVGAHLRATAPDVLVVFTADHYNLFYDACVPVFSVGVAGSAAGASDYPDLPRRVVPIASGLARRVHAHLVRAGFDAGMSQQLELDHTVIAPLALLGAAADVPIVPVFVNGLIPPLPAAARCLALGRAIREAVRTAPDDRRVAALASGSFSLEVGGPRIAADSHTGVPAPEWAERVVELLGAGDVDALVAEATEDRIADAGNAGGELLVWIAMLGTIDAAPPAFLEAQPAFGHAFAAWPASAPPPPRSRGRATPRSRAADAGRSAYAVNALCRRVVHQPELRAELARDPEGALRAARPALDEEQIAALLAGDVGRLSRMGANHFLLHQLGRWEVLGLDLPRYAERIRAAWS